MKIAAVVTASTVLTAAFLIAGGELFARIFYRGSPLPTFEIWESKEQYRLSDTDPDYYGLIPRNEFTWDGNLVYRTSSLGLRNREVSPEPEKGTCRILMLGDSVTFGLGIPENETFCRLMEEELNRRGGRAFEIINAGVPGYGLVQYRKYLERSGKRLHPRLVVVNFTAYDCEDIVIRDEAGNRKLRVMHFIPVEAQRVLPIPMAYHLWLVNHSYIYRFFNRRASHFIYSVKGIVSPAAQESFAGIGRREMEGIIRTARECGARVLLVIHPFFKAETWGNYERESGWHHRLGAEIARTAGVPSLDLLDAFKRAGDIRELSNDIIHPNAKGHRVIAGALLDYLARNRITPPPPGHRAGICDGP